MPSQAPAQNSSHGILVANLLAQIAFGLLAMTICASRLATSIPWLEFWAGACEGITQTLVIVQAASIGRRKLVLGPGFEVGGVVAFV